MYATIGVLPVPPTRRLPTLTTGRVSDRRRDGIARVPLAPPRGRRAVGRAQRLDQCTSRKGRTTARPRPPTASGSSSAMTASVFVFAPRLASTSARAAAPRPARRTGSVTSASSALFELAIGRHLHGRAVAQERVGDLLEVLHVRPEHDRLAEHRRLEDVVAAVIDEAAADEHRRRDLIELRQLADRIEHHHVGARLGVDRQLGAARW